MKTIPSPNKLQTAQKDFWKAMSTLMAFQKQAPPLIPVDRNGVIPLSYSQERLWFLDQLQSGEFSAYNQPLGFKIEGKLNIIALEKSLNTIVQRHEVLRTNFVEVKGQPTQIIHPEITLNLSVIDLRSVAESDRLNQARQLLIEEAQKPFNLAEAPLLRAKLVQLGSEESFFLLTLHHIITDAWSKGVLFKELATLYKAFSQEQPSPLPELPIQYADFAVWQRQWLQGEFRHTLLDYWQQQLNNQPKKLDLPTDRPQDCSLTRRSALQELILGQKLTTELKALSRTQGVTLFATLLAAFYVLLYRYTEQDDLFVCSPIANRNHPKIKGLIGYCSNLLILRTHLNGDSSFQEFVNQVSKVISGGYTYQDLPVQEVINSLNLPGFSLSQVMFALQNTTLHTLDLLGLTVSNVDFDNGRADFDVYLSMQEKAGTLVGALKYNTDLFTEETIQEMLHHYQIILENLVSNPEQSLSELLPLSDREASGLREKREKVKQVHPSDKSIYIAPRNVVEEQLTEIWQKVLGIKSIGVRDNFFDLGGKSMLAMRLFADIEQTFGKNLPLSTLFAAPTIEKLAKYCSDEGRAKQWRALVPIQPQGSKPPVYFVHEISGKVLFFRNLADYLGQDQPFYALQAKGVDGQQTPYTKVEDMAAHYIQDIRELQPTGPYFIGGYSFGSVVAFEMARQLEAQGQEVPFVALFDVPAFPNSSISLWERGYIHINNLSFLQWQEKVNYLRKWIKVKIQQKIINKYRKPHENTSITFQDQVYRQVNQANRQARENYEPKVYPGKLILFRSQMMSRKYYFSDADGGWGQLALGGVEVVNVPGNHVTMIKEPNLPILAEKLQVCLDKAQGN